MSDTTPFPLSWDGECFKPPTPYWQNKADQRFVIGMKYLMIEQLERSINAHRHYFVTLHEAWQNLPEDKTSEFPSLEHFRKRGLVATGWRDETVIVLEDSEQAERAASLVQELDSFLVVVKHDNTVTVLTPKSQSLREMGSKDFQKSKRDVLGWAWALVGVDPDVGAANAGRAA
jgi:hypothetical protein